MVEVGLVGAEAQLEVVLGEGEDGALGRVLLAQLELFQHELQLVSGAQWGVGIVINVGVGRRCDHGCRLRMERMPGTGGNGRLAVPA